MLATKTYNFDRSGTLVCQSTSSTMDSHRNSVHDSGISETPSATSAGSSGTTLASNVRRRRGLDLCCKETSCKDVINKRVPITSWLPQYKLGYLPQDILAGITVGLTAIPQGIAYAGVAGLPPQYGLYSGIMGCFVYLILGSCKDVNIGPTAIMALMIQPHVETLGPDIAVLACFLTGCVILLLGILQLGFLVDFISFPVVSGFTSAAAITIGSSQLKGLFGLKKGSNDFLPAWEAVFTHIQDAKLGDSLLSFGSIIFLLVAKKLGQYGNREYKPEWTRARNFLGRFLWMFSLSRNAIIVLFGTFLAWCLSENGKVPFAIIGSVGQGMPPIGLPPFSTEYKNQTYEFPDMAKQLGTTIIFMPLVAILESIAITKAFSKGKSVDATQELIALGCCNIGGSFMRSMSTTGSFTRTALNNASGVVTTLGGVFTAVIVLLALELLTSTFYFIPKATLSAVIIVAMIFMVEVEAVILLWRTKKIELVLYFVTLIASLFLGVEYGILIGIACNILLILYSSARPPVTINKESIGHLDVMMVTPTASLHYPAAEYLRHQIIINSDNHLDIVINGLYVISIDTTVAKNIQILVKDMKTRNQGIYLWNFSNSVKRCCVDMDNQLEGYFHDGELESILKKHTIPEIEIQR